MPEQEPFVTSPNPSTQPAAGHWTAKQLRVVKLLGDPELNHAQIAQIVGIHRRTVAAISSRLQMANVDQTAELEAYRAQLRKRVPIKSRVDCLATIVRPEQAKSNPFSVIRAIEYVDTVAGLHPKTAPEPAQSDKTQPMFVLPAGARVQINIDQRPQTPLPVVVEGSSGDPGDKDD